MSGDTCWEAAASLNMTYWQTMHRVIILQAARVALPSRVNTFLSLVKDASLLTMITVNEMFYHAKIVGARAFDDMTVYILVAFLSGKNRKNDTGVMPHRKEGTGLIRVKDLYQSLKGIQLDVRQGEVVCSSGRAGRESYVA